MTSGPRRSAAPEHNSLVSVLMNGAPTDPAQVTPPSREIRHYPRRSTVHSDASMIVKPSADSTKYHQGDTWVGVSSGVKSSDSTNRGGWTPARLRGAPGCLPAEGIARGGTR